MIKNYLDKLGLHAEEIKLYLGLLGQAQQTVQELANKTGVAKTTAYRRLRRLRQLGLVEEILSDFTTFYQPAHPSRLQLLVDERARQIAELETTLPEVSGLIAKALSVTDPTTQVKYYKGIEGIRQMTWNILQGKGDLCGYTYRVFSEVGERFARDWSQEFAQTGRKARDLYSDEYLDSEKSGLKVQNKNSAGFWSSWQSRYISSKLLDIRLQMDIYDNTVGLYKWHQGEVFGIEIVNHEIATLQRQLFELAWRAANNSLS